MSKISETIKSYKSLRIERLDIWLLDCKNEISFERCIDMAAKARNNENKKHPHQYRIQNVILEDFAQKLLSNKNSLLLSKNFLELYYKVSDLKLKGIGLLTLYDTSHRIGMNLNLHPEKVFLHRGAKIGAEKILKRKIKTRTIDKNEFKMFSELTCSEIEDILCMSKGDLNNSNCLSGKKRKNSCV